MKSALNRLTDEKVKELQKKIAIGMSEKKFAFNIRTGEVKSFENKDEYELEFSRTEGWLGVECKPKSNCNTCYGRGYVGHITHKVSEKDGKIEIVRYVPCGCMMAKAKRG
jgi:hypothetical protein